MAISWRPHFSIRGRLFGSEHWCSLNLPWCIPGVVQEVSILAYQVIVPGEDRSAIISIIRRPGPHFLFLSELTCYSVMVNPIAIQEFWDLSIHPIHFAALSFGLQSQALLCHPSMLTLNSCFHLQLKHFYRSILVHLRIQENLFNLQPNPTSEVYVRSQKKASNKKIFHGDINSVISEIHSWNK